MNSNTSFDVAIIGGGPGGYVCAIRAAQLGLNVALIEKDSLGGVCLNWGCIPTKALLKTAEVYKTLQKAADFGIELKSTPTIDIKKAVERSRAVSTQLTKGIQYLMKKNKVTVFEGTGKLKNTKEITIQDKSGKTSSIQTKNIVIATGARARKLPLPPETSPFIWTSKEAMLPESLPKSLVIVGSGAIGIEFASFYKTLGSTVTVVEMMDRILPQEDKEISTLAQKSFEKQGIQFFLSSKTTSFVPGKDTINVTIEGPSKKETLSVEKVILAIGIEGNTENLGLENIKVKVEKTHIVTHGICETDSPGIYAIGDVTGAPWLAHKGSHEGILVAEKIAGLKVHPLDTTKIPGCTYSIPQIASVGFTEEKAKGLGYALKVGRFPFSANGKALSSGETEGLIKTIFDAQTGELLGAHLIGSEVTELIQGFTLARTLEATEAEIMETIFPHPTLSEMMHESVLDAFGQVIHA